MEQPSSYAAASSGSSCSFKFTLLLQVHAAFVQTHAILSSSVCVWGLCSCKHATLPSSCHLFKLMVLLEAYTAPLSLCRSFKLMALIKAHAAPSKFTLLFKFMLLLQVHGALLNSCHSFKLKLFPQAHSPHLSSHCIFKLMPLFQADATLSS